MGRLQLWHINSPASNAFCLVRVTSARVRRPARSSALTSSHTADIGRLRKRSHKRVLLWDWQPFHGVNHIDANKIDDVYFLKIQVFYEPRHSRSGPRLASNDEGDARPNEVCSRRY